MHWPLVEPKIVNLLYGNYSSDSITKVFNIAGVMLPNHALRKLKPKSSLKPKSLPSFTKKEPTSALKVSTSWVICSPAVEVAYRHVFVSRAEKASSNLANFWKWTTASHSLDQAVPLWSFKAFWMRILRGIGRIIVAFIHKCARK